MSEIVTIKISRRVLTTATKVVVVCCVTAALYIYRAEILSGLCICDKIRAISQITSDNH